MLGEPFSSVVGLRAAFEAGLSRLAVEGGLGAFILACANACFEAELFSRMRPQLEGRFERLAQDLRDALRTGRAVPEADDDVLVFLKLLAVGFDHLRPTRTRFAGPWEVQFNTMRAFRPPRAAQGIPKGIRAEFNHHGFHFNRRFLQREVFWSGELLGRAVCLLYNKYPFIDLHGLLVPDRREHRPQFLTREDHYYVWALAQALARGLPGVGIAYNAYGALASVNHLHFQMFVRQPELPVGAPRWRHNGGAEPYPARCEVFADPRIAWLRIEDLHRAEEPYNLLYRPGRLFCLPRLRQGTYSPAAWATGFAWYEMAGGVTVFNPADFAQLEAGAIAHELTRASGLAPSPQAPAAEPGA